MTAYIVFVAMLLSIYMIRTHSLEEAFLYVWIPFFVLMPNSFYVHIQGFASYSFMQAAIIPIVFVLVIRNFMSFRIGTMEILMATYMIFRILVDYSSRGYADAQNYTFFLLTSMAGPYLIGRYLIKSRELDIETAKMFVLMFIIMVPMFLVELRIWVTPIYKILAPLFPTAESGLSLRYGIARVHGSYTHPILACVMVLIAYRLHRWLCWMHVWDQPQRGLLGFFQRLSTIFLIPFSYQVSIMFLLIALLTISRGPWIGGVFGAVVAATGRSKNSNRIVKFVAVGLIVAAVIGGLALNAYITPAPGTTLSEEAGTLLYRKVLVDRYIGFVAQRPWAGWGLTTVPQVPGMESVDNGFLLMALEHGLPAPILFALIFLFAIVSQIRFGSRPIADRPAIGFTFAGIYVMCFVAFTTVYIGAQTMPMLFLLLGWGESIRNREPNDEIAPAPVFKRVLC